MICPNCRQQVLDGSKFCDSCGATLMNAAASDGSGIPSTLPPTVVQPGRGGNSPAQIVCPRCQVPGSGAYCDHCGAPLGYRPTYQQPVATPMPSLPLFILQPANILFPFPGGKHEVFIGREDPGKQFIPDINFEAYGGADAGVSRHHARVYFDGTQWYLEHLSHINKTFINDVGVALGHSRLLKNGDLVFIGRLTMLFRT